MNELKARVADFSRRRDRLRIAVERDEASLGREPLQNQPAVAAPSESAVHIKSVGRTHQRFRSFLTENGEMEKGGHGVDSGRQGNK